MTSVLAYVRIELDAATQKVLEALIEARELLDDVAEDMPWKEELREVRTLLDLVASKLRFRKS